MKIPMKPPSVLTVVVLGLTILAPVVPLAAEAPSVTIIHNGKAIIVAASAVPAHLAHGDCDPTVPPGCQ